MFDDIEGRPFKRTSAKAPAVTLDEITLKEYGSTFATPVRKLTITKSGGIAKNFVDKPATKTTLRKNLQRH